MSIWVLVQIVVNIFLLAGLGVCLIKVFKEKGDDPRLTQGLRLLQSKISILEDLSDHTENQVKQLMMLLDKKLHEVRGTIEHMNSKMGEVDRSIAETKQMAKKIQNDLSSDTIVEKKLENKYIQAAQMAHKGHSADEIVRALNLPRAEVELIARVNKKKCVYGGGSPNLQDRIFSKSLEMPEIASTSADQAQIDFQQAVDDHNERAKFQSVKLG